jgi:hypothetical protein
LATPFAALSQKSIKDTASDGLAAAAFRKDEAGEGDQHSLVYCIAYLPHTLHTCLL